MLRIELTIEHLKDKDNIQKVLAIGYTNDDAQGLNMTRSGKLLLWVLKVGEIGDWCVYCHWADRGVDYVLESGDKVISKANIDNILHITDEVWARYRF